MNPTLMLLRTMAPGANYLVPLASTSVLSHQWTSSQRMNFGGCCVTFLYGRKQSLLPPTGYPTWAWWTTEFLWLKNRSMGERLLTAGWVTPKQPHHRKVLTSAWIMTSHSYIDGVPHSVNLPTSDQRPQHLVRHLEISDLCTLRPWDHILLGQNCIQGRGGDAELSDWNLRWGSNDHSHPLFLWGNLNLVEGLLV